MRKAQASRFSAFTLKSKENSSQMLSGQQRNSTDEVQQVGQMYDWLTKFLDRFWILNFHCSIFLSSLV